MKYTKIERERLRSLVSDCVIFNLSEKESLEYIKMRFSKGIVPSYFYSIKKSLQGDRETQAWLNEFCRVGFVSEHRKRLEELQLVHKILFEMLYIERQKGDAADQNAILFIIDEIARIGKRLTGLQSGTLIISQICVMLLEHQQQPSIITTSAYAKDGEGKSKDNDDLVLFSNMTADIEDPIKKYETLAALYKARADELHAKNHQQ